MRGVLSQDGQYIYAVDNFQFPQDVKKFDINDGKATYLYDSPYHGDYPLGHDVWFLKDRNSIFSGRTFLKTTNSQNTDLRYDGVLDLSKAFPVNYNVTAFAQTPDQSTLFVGMNHPFLIHTNDKNVLASYNSKTGAFIKKYNLGYSGKDGSVTEAMPKYIWVQNNKLHVLIKDFFEEIYYIRSYVI
jgi:hypothetical protein